MSLIATAVQKLSEAPNGFRGLTANLSKELIEQVCYATDATPGRRRRLPKDTTTFLLVGMALFRNESIQQVAKTMNICLGKAPSSSSVSDARKRLSAEPLRKLFQQIGEDWARSAPGYEWRGLKTYGIDGSVLALYDSKANVSEFGKPGHRKDKSSASYPQVRVVGLMELSSKMIIDAEVGPLSDGENTAVRPLLARIPENSLTILDRGFQSRFNFVNLFSQEQNKHFLCRLKSTFRAQWIKDLDGCSWVGRLIFTKKERSENPALPAQTDLRIIEYKVKETSEIIRVATSLLNEKTHPSKEIAELYHMRWEFELGLRDMKTTLLQSKDTIRSKTPDGVRQEIWAIFLAYNLVRKEMAVVAARNEVSPARLSFKTSMVTVINFFNVFSSGYADLDSIPNALTDMRQWIWQKRLPVRDPHRVCPRWVKNKQPSKFPKKPPTPSGV
jgi:hypothetical protein